MKSLVVGTHSRPRVPIDTAAIVDHCEPCPQFSQRAAEEGIELAELAISFSRRIFDSTKRPIWI